MTETVFEILAEGGSLTIQRKRNRNGEKFIYHHAEMDLTDEDLDVDEQGVYKTFDVPFQLINSKYTWFRLHLETVHEDYRKYVLDELIKSLTYQGITPDELRYAQEALENVLDIKLKFGYPPIKSGLQNITIQNLIKFTKYEHHEYKENYEAPSNESKYVPKAKFETWLAGAQHFQHDQVTMSSNIVDSLETIGKLEVNGNTIIIKNEFGKIEFAFSSDKFFVTTTPVLSKTKGWYYTRK